MAINPLLWLRNAPKDDSVVNRSATMASMVAASDKGQTGGSSQHFEESANALISAVLHRSPGPASEGALDLRPGELALLVPLLLRLLALSAWPAGITDRTFGQNSQSPALQSIR